MKTGKRFMSIFLSLIILISLCSGSAFAAGEDEKSLPEENNEEWIITEMSALDEAVMNQTVPQLAGDIGGNGLSDGRRTAGGSS